MAKKKASSKKDDGKILNFPTKKLAREVMRQVQEEVRAQAEKSKSERRSGRVMPGGPDEPAKFVEGGAAAPEFDPDQIVKEAGLWWEQDGGDNFIVEVRKGLWSLWPKQAVIDYLKDLPGQYISAVVRKDVPGERTSQMEKVLRHARSERCVAKLLDGLAGYKADVHTFMGGKRVIVRNSPCPVVAKKGDWSLLRRVLEGMFNLELKDTMEVDEFGNYEVDKPGEINQTPYFHAWALTGHTSILKGKPGSYKQGHALVLAGPSNCWKSTLQDTVITPLLGGRQANPMPYLLGKDNYNQDMMESEHLAMGELPTSSQKTVDRVQLSENIKTLVVNRMHRLRIMKVDPVTVMPFWRLSISLNNDPDKMRSFPMLTGDFKDKVLMLLVAKRPLPMPSRTNEEQEAFAAAIAAQLPAYAYWLMNDFKIPERLLVDDNGEEATRFGFRDFQHPSLSMELFDDTPHAKLLRLIDASEFFAVVSGKKGVTVQKLWGLAEQWNSFAEPARRGAPRTIGKEMIEAAGDAGIWEGSAIDLEKLLTDEVEGLSCSVGKEMGKLLRFNEDVSRLLSRLAKDKPERVKHRKMNSAWIWMIAPPLAED